MENLTFVLEVVQLTNEFRAANGLGPLSIDLDLLEAAQLHAQNMALQDFFGHVGIDGSRSWQRAMSAGYESSFVGENVAGGYGIPADVVQGWIDSPGHRANMLDASWNEIGAGYYFLSSDPGDVSWNSYWVQVFGQGEIEPPVEIIEPYNYGASYADLILSLGDNRDALFSHYNTLGKAEGRSPDLFDEVGYLASNEDLLLAFLNDYQSAARHYIQFGYYEGRSTNLFSAAQYLASHDDVLGLVGPDMKAATTHYVEEGYWSEKERDIFDEARYLASYGDLIEAFGYDLEAATLHYIYQGVSENRAKALFDANAYLNNYADLQAAFGSDLAAATRHYIIYGFEEGRIWS